MELDHLFVFVADRAEAEDEVARLGLVETYRRQHPGQGTENVCCALDDAYVEFLWVHDTREVQSDPIRRTRLYERSRSRTEGTCPFGLAWRNADTSTLGALDCWDYTPPYLPTGVSIPVARASDDPTQPMLFGSPGTGPPMGWATERRGRLQREAGRTRIASLTLGLPETTAPSATLRTVADRLGIRLVETPRWSLELEVERIDGRPPVRLSIVRPGPA